MSARKRPLSIQLISLAFLLSPVGVLAELFYLYRIPLAYWRKVFYYEFWTWQIVAFVIVTPLVGLCVWTVHRWAYWVLIAFTGLILANNLAVWISGSGMSSAMDRVFLMAGLMALVLLEIRKVFYAPYFNPRMRRWEQANRYVTDRIRVILKEFASDEHIFEAKSFDVSEAGIYIATDHPAQIGEAYKLEIILPGDRPIHTTGEVVWVHGGNDANPQGFGCRFTTKSRHFNSLIRASVKELHASARER